MTRVRGSLEILRPMEEVFDTVADQTNEVRYNPRMRTAVKVTDGPIGVGTMFEATVLNRGRPAGLTIEYTGFDRPRRSTSRSVMSEGVVEGTLRCDPAEGGTRLSWDWHLTLSGPARLAGPLVGWIGARQEKQTWTGLKRHLEAGAA
ncbi:MAG: SRPBCC family protein [Dermatophilaceae bacterium]